MLAAVTCAALALSAAPSMAIVGGSDAAAGEYPSVSEVVIAKGFLCTGTLIAPNYVLTAGHCGSITGGSGVASPAAWPAAAIDVFVGSNKPGQGEKVPVESVTVEPKYLLNSGYDITLLKLSRNSTTRPPRSRRRRCRSPRTPTAPAPTATSTPPRWSARATREAAPTRARATPAARCSAATARAR
jgi:secreted trypsin-like serine protease